jgi:CBS domain-containing protein/gamma-glutamylcysteine synthetase
MGEQRILETEDEKAALRAFMRRLLMDLRALEKVLADGMIETGVRRIGAEQEMFLVDRDWRPAPAALQMLERLRDPHFVTELALFNLEMNLDPLPFGGDCLRRMERQVDELLAKAREAGRGIGVTPVLTGNLPTIRKSDLGLENMTPFPRYAALNRAMTRLRGRDYEISIKGVDELMVQHDSVMVEACNASFQAHLQVSAAEFARFYNVAQVVTAPVLAAAVNSPLLFGHRLWHETRIAVFQQAVDTRGADHHLRERSPRVDFGRGWVRDSVVEMYQEDIARYRVLIAGESDEDPFEVLARGKAPELRSLRLHNGTVYRWNRACYGLTDGKPHLRIECRVLPSGPTPVDEVANAAFWFGLVTAMAAEHEDVTKHVAFEDAKLNFLGAARHGLGAQFTWLDGLHVPAQSLIAERLIPMAREGLTAARVDEGDVDRYLGVLEERVRSGRTGATWLLKSHAEMRGHGTQGERLNAITAATVARQAEGRPVAQWPLARLEEAGGWKHNYLRVEQFMTTDLTTVHEHELVDLVANLMVWQRIRYIPVEDDRNRLVGLVSHRQLLRVLAQGLSEVRAKPISVGEVMKRDPLTVAPETSTLRAIQIMRQNKIGCLPVVQGDRLVGVLTERDFMDIAAELLQQGLRGAEAEGG